MRARESLLLSAAEYLASLGNPQAPFVVIVCQGGEKHQLPADGWPQTPARAWRMFGPLEERIVEALEGKGWIATADLAAAIAEEPSNDFRLTVRNLAERGVLETSTRWGLRLKACSQPDPG